MEAWPCLTVLRGKIVVDKGRYLGGLDDGRWQQRRIDPDIIRAPRLA